MSSPRLRAEPSAGLGGAFRPPSDKSISHRALILGAMAAGDTHVDGLLQSDDVLATARAVAALGAEVERVGPDRWRVRGSHRWRSPADPLDCGNSGTAGRLLLGAIAGRPITATLTGDASLRRRPMARVVEPLAAMGARFAPHGGTLPLTVMGGALGPLRYRAPVASAQVKSAILLAGLGAKGEVEVVEPVPTRDHSERLLRAMGVEVEITDGPDGRSIRLGAGRTLSPVQLAVPADPSSAAFLLVAALLVPGSDVSATGVLHSPYRDGFLRALRGMGADLHLTGEGEAASERTATIRARSSGLRGAVLPAAVAASAIDEYPILAVAAAFADGPTRLEGLAELRHKESDRLARIADGLRRCGVEVEEGPDSLVIHGRGGPPPGGALVETGGDHRISMAFLVLGLAARAPVTVDGAGMIATSYPGFVAQARALGARLEAA